MINLFFLIYEPPMELVTHLVCFFLFLYSFTLPFIKNDQLVTLGFNREQIIKGIVAILSGESGTYFDSGVQTSVASNESLSLETLLDWFCIHLITEELPRLFVPVKGQEAGGEGDKTPVIVLPRESTTDKSVEMTTTSARAPPQLIEMFLQTF